MKLLKIVEAGLKAEGFDGLYVSGVCGCVIGDLSPGDCIGEFCEAGYKHTHSKRPLDFCISKNKIKMTDEEISEVISTCC